MRTRSKESKEEDEREKTHHPTILTANQLLNPLSDLLRVLKNAPNPPLHPLKSLLEPPIPILRLLIHARNALDLANENRPDPAGEIPRASPVSLGIGLRRVAYENHFPLRQPGVDFGDAGGFVLLRALAERGDQAAEVLPRGVAEDQGAGGEMG